MGITEANADFYGSVTIRLMVAHMFSRQKSQIQSSDLPVKGSSQLAGLKMSSVIYLGETMLAGVDVARLIQYNAA